MMSSFELLDDYSKGFASRLFIEFPQYQKYTQVKKDDDHCHESYLYIEIPCPSNTDSQLWISTEDNEITVGFGGYHTHFGYNDDREEDYEEAINFIKEIINEKLIIIVARKDEIESFSTYIKCNEISTVIKKGDNIESIVLKSWNGTYNKEIFLEN